MTKSSVEVLWTARYDYRPNWKLEKHRHQYFQMIYFLDGAGRFLIQGREYPIAKNVLFLIRPNQFHEFSASALIKTLDIKFLVRDQWLNQRLAKTRTSILNEDSEIPRLFERIRFEGESKGPLFRELCSSYLFQMLILYLRRHGDAIEIRPSTLPRNGQALPDPVSQRVLQIIQANYRQELDLQQIAQRLGLSDRSVREHFRNSTGMSPMRYLLFCRIEEARNLIRYSDYALKEIAEMVGFKSLHHFNRLFRETVGTPPGAWRREYREGICKDVYIDPHFANVVWTVKNKSAKTASRQNSRSKQERAALIG